MGCFNHQPVNLIIWDSVFFGCTKIVRKEWIRNPWILVCFFDDFLRIGIPWDSSPFFNQPVGIYIVFLELCSKHRRIKSKNQWDPWSAGAVLVGMWVTQDYGSRFRLSCSSDKKAELGEGYDLHPSKLTWHWYIPMFNKKYIFKLMIPLKKLEFQWKPKTRFPFFVGVNFKSPTKKDSAFMEFSSCQLLSSVVWHWGVPKTL